MCSYRNGAVSKAVYRFFQILFPKGEMVFLDLAIFLRNGILFLGVSGEGKLVFGVSDGGGRAYTDFLKFCSLTGKWCCSWT